MDPGSEKAFKDIMINEAAADPDIKLIANIVSDEWKDDAVDPDTDVTARFAELAWPTLKGYCLTNMPDDADTVLIRVVGNRLSKRDEGEL